MKYFLIFNLILEIILTCLIPWSKSIFFDQLGTFSHLAWYGLLLYIGVLIVLDIVQNFKPLLITYVANISRMVYTAKYFSKGLENITRHQRIQEDIKLYTLNKTIVYSEYFISGFIVLALTIQNIHDPVLVGASAGYSLICLGSAWLFKPNMIDAEKNIQQSETRFREILNIKGFSWSEILLVCNDVIRANLRNAKIKFNYGLCVKLQTGLMTLLPYIYLLPQYLTKQVSLGTMMEQASIFQLLVINVIIFTQLFPQWMQSKASKERLEELI